MAREDLGCKVYDIVAGEYIWTGDFTFCLSKDSYNVYVSLLLESHGTGIATVDWIMYLERYYSGQGWVTVGTRTGYVSDISPSNRTFTNVGGYGTEMRVSVTLKEIGWYARYFTR